jgi:hypothetical protein
MLRHWKEEAEKRAARETAGRPDVVAELMKDLETARDTLFALAAVGRHDYSDHLPFRGRSEEDTERAWHDETRRLLEASNRRRDEFNRHALPKIRNCLDRCRAILGPEDPLMVAAEQEVRGAGTNPLSMEAMAEQLESLRTALELR